MIEFEEYKVKLNNLKPTLDGLREALHLEAAEKEIEELEGQSARDGFWNDVENSQRVQKRLKQLKGKTENYAKLCAQWDDLMTLCEMAIEENDDSMLPELQSDFSAFEKLMDYLDGDEAGIKSATIMIEGENAYGFLKSENGIHRLVRISPFDSSGRRHTSFAALEVMPEISDDNEIELRDEDIKMDVYRSSGAGGQKVNKTSSAVRLTHIPTGIVVASQVERSHFQNLENCKNMLRARLAEIKEREHLEKISDIKGVQLKIEWGSQIRSYVFMPYTLAKDHRTGFENGNIQNVMDGDIDGFINAFLAMKAAN